MNDALFSSKSDEWTTPKNVFNELNNEFRFDIDVASTDENALCKRHFTASENGLLQDWGGVPYGAIHRIPTSKSGCRKHTKNGTTQRESCF